MTTATGYAEMFEWVDGNPDNEDRVGHTVVLVNDKIAIAAQDALPADIIGVIGGDNTSVAAISNASPEEWHGKHLRDEYNRLLWEPQVMVEWIDSNNSYRHWYEADRIPAGIEVPPGATFYNDVWNGHKLIRQVLSEKYKNPNKTVEHYLPRWERKEWGIVVLLGRAKIKNGSPLNPNWKPLSNGATASEWLVR